MSSAYPIAVDTLTDRVRDHATEAGTWPSLREIMTRHKVGRPKASAALDALRTAGFDPTHPAADTVTVPAADTAVDTVAGAPTGVPGPTGTTVSALAIPVVDAHASAPTGQPDDHNPDPIDYPLDGPAAIAPVGRIDELGAGEVPGMALDTGPVVRAGRAWAWPLAVIAAGAFVSIWGGWVGLGALAGFGPIRLLPGIADQVVVNSAITLPLGVEAYAAFALRAWLAPTPGTSTTARRFARWSAIGALALGASGQIAYHLMTAAGITVAPWPITAFVSCLPVIVLGCGAALTHLIHHQTPPEDPA